jgi:hypothetical protein
LRKFTNRSDKAPSTLNLTGAFMNSGKTRLDATFLPRQTDPELDLSLAIEPTDLRTMNDWLRAYGDFDVVDGRFSFYSQLRIKHGQIEGYVKPLFATWVYDRRQDATSRYSTRSMRAWSAVWQGCSKIAAIRSPLRPVKGGGVASDSTWEVVVNLLRNAFLNAIARFRKRTARRAMLDRRNHRTVDRAQHETTLFGTRRCNSASQKKPLLRSDIGSLARRDSCFGMRLVGQVLLFSSKQAANSAVGKERRP